MSNDLVKSAESEVPTSTRINSVVNEIMMIDEVYKNIMKKDVHYGKIPGVEKSILMKAGAEKLGQLFQVTPEYETHEKALDGGHKEYRVDCRLYRGESTRPVGHGVGLCTTMESKYRYRQEKIVESTGRQVPKEYWDKRKANASREVLEGILGGKGLSAKKIDDQWMIVKTTGDGERHENPDIADLYNTVLKMAKKRAYVDSVLTLSSCSDIFDQDLDEMLDNMHRAEAPEPSQTVDKPAEQTAPKQEASPAVEPAATVVQDHQGDALKALIVAKKDELKMKASDVKSIVGRIAPDCVGSTGIISEKLTQEIVNKVIEEMTTTQGGLF